jgi:hypothetical protein
MRKNLLAKSIATLVSGFALVGGAHAVIVANPTAPANVAPAQTLEVNEDGIGHSLLYPYFNAQGTNYTLFTVTNTDMLNGKAIKIRFRGAENSDDVYDITVFLSPGDVWNANITRGADGIAKLNTADKSCTLPNNVNGSFVTNRLSSAQSAAQKAQSTTEGYIEVFNMADIPPMRTAAGGGGVNPLYTATKHINGVPPGCAESGAVMQALFTDPTDVISAETLGFGAPTTGLMGEWTILNGPAAASWAAPAVAIEGRVGNLDVPGYGNIVFFPQNNTPVAALLVAQATSDPLLRGGTEDNRVATLGTAAPVQALNFDFPDMSTPYLNSDGAILANGTATRRQAYRLSRALAVTSVSNEFVTGSGILAMTDWTLSSPSRRYNVARNYAANANLYTNLGFDDLAVPVPAVLVPPNQAATTNPTNYYTPTNIAVTTYSGTAPQGVICVLGSTVQFTAGVNTPVPNNYITGVNANTEENFVATGPSGFVISPGQGPGQPDNLCGEVSVASFNAARPALSVLNAQITRFDLTGVNAAGWQRIATPGLVVAAGQGLGGSTRNGLPIVGHAFIQFTNNNALAGGAAAGTIANYDETFKHRHTRY